MATVLLVDTGTIVRCSARGEFLLRYLPAGATEAVIEVGAIGYEAVRETLPASRNDTTRINYSLDPTGTAHLHVVDSEGAGLMGVSIRGRLAFSSTLGELGVVGHTNEGGTAHIALAGELWVAAEYRGEESTWRRIRPGSRVEFVLGEAELNVVFVDTATGEPLPGVPVSVSRGMQPEEAARELLTDDAGLISVPAPRRHHLNMELLDLAVRDIVSVDPPDTGFSITSRRTITLGPIHNVKETPGTLRINVSRCRQGIQLISDATGEPIVDGPVKWRREVFHLVKRRWMPNYPNTVPALEDGWLWIPCGGEGPNAGTATRLLVEASGFQPAFLDNPAAVLGDATSGVILRLRRGPPAAYVDLRYPGGAAVVQPITIVDEGSRDYLFTGTSDPLRKGRYGPFSLGAEGVRVLGRLGEVETRIPTEAFVREGESVVAAAELRGGSGALRIVGVPARSPRIYLMDSYGYRWDPTPDGETLLFPSVPPGEYVVGPKRWVRSEMSRLHVPGFKGFVRVSPHQEQLVDWNMAWSLDHDVRAAVTLRPRGAKPWIIPVFGELESPIPVRPDSGIALGEHGEYLLPRGSPLPSALLVVSQHPGEGSPGFHILDAVRPGESVEIMVQDIVLETSSRSPSDSGTSVEYTIDSSGFSVPVQLIGKRVSVFLLRSRTVLLAGIPSRVNALVLRNKAGTVEEVLLGPKPGQQQVLRIGVGDGLMDR